jgi:hypothetical protein
MIRSFVMAGVILGVASLFAVAGSVTTYDQNGNPSYGAVNPNGSVDAYDQNGNYSNGRVSPGRPIPMNSVANFSPGASVGTDSNGAAVGIDPNFVRTFQDPVPRWAQHDAPLARMVTDATGVEHPATPAGGTSQHAGPPTVAEFIASARAAKMTPYQANMLLGLYPSVTTYDQNGNPSYGR